MNALIATRPRRWGLTAAAFVLAVLLALLWAWHADQTQARIWTPEDLVTRLFALPGLLAIAVLTLTTACARLPASPAAAAPAPAATAPAGPFKAQVVGIQWMNPLVRRGYPVEWNLLWTLGLAKPNKDDELVKEDPKTFSSVQFVSTIESNYNGRYPLKSIFAGYMGTMFQPIGRRYALNGDYFYTVQPEDPKRWRELHGIHVQFAIPATDKLPPEEAAQIVRQALNTEFEFSTVPALSTKNIPADVHMTAGGANAGFTSLSAAMDYLEAHPDKTAWAMTWDSPDFPRDNSIAENAVLLVLAGPTYDTGREPLAWLGRPATRDAKDYETQEKQSRASQAWKAALVAASENAGVKPMQLGYVIHDAGAGTEAGGKRIGRLGQVLTENHPEFDFMAQTFDTAKLLGDMRAGSALTDVALAVAWTHQRGQPVLVAGTHEPDRPTLMVVTPPARARHVDPDKNWFRARGEGNAYLPWWGLQKNVDWNKYMQGFSD